MGLASSVGHTFSLDVLDGQHRTKDPTLAKRLRWNTPEFYFYYLVFIICIPLMFKAVIDISDPSHPNYPKYEHLLQPGLFGERKVDNSDTQYASFRNQIPVLFLVMAGHQAARRAFDAVVSKTRAERRLAFDLLFGMIFLFVIHGFGALKLLIISSSTYLIARQGRGSRANPALTWITVIALLFLNEKYQGYRFISVHPALAPLDQWNGLLDRWHIHFNITALRLISYNLDYYWSIKSPIKQETPSEMTERERVDVPAAPSNFNYLTFLAYTFYSPLYLAGPILTFNNYISQCSSRPSSISTYRTFQYFLRLLFAILTMEITLHYIYVVAISKAHAWDGISPLQIAMMGYFNLHIIWLKLLIPWRFFRLWALTDDIETVENMIRCMSNNYSALAFWRAWHRSFNRWIIRYIYIPLGGGGGGGGDPPSTYRVSETTAAAAGTDADRTLNPSIALQEPKEARKNEERVLDRAITGTEYRKAKKQITRTGVLYTIINMMTVFTFVAIWHDISLTLLTWGWLIVLFLIPEILLTSLSTSLSLHQSRLFRYASGVGGVMNVLGMMGANLVGFSVGVEGVREMVGEMVGSVGGVGVLVGSCGALFVGVQVMFQVREDELSRGIRLRC